MMENAVQDRRSDDPVSEFPEVNPLCLCFEVSVLGARGPAPISIHGSRSCYRLAAELDWGVKTTLPILVGFQVWRAGGRT